MVAVHTRHIAALPLPVLLQRTRKYASVRASAAPCTALEYGRPESVQWFGGLSE